MPVAGGIGQTCVKSYPKMKGGKAGQPGKDGPGGMGKKRMLQGQGPSSGGQGQSGNKMQMMG